ncbi:unnamed protein product [Pieris macdunnoughi]|uniref:Uncharacterized protein n=1 Tax=Pieris macdunnoughi TaxID=345717 RepID=A0A821Y6K9_9NEOP|nr:unnamed protein product [Pieris macdunnoughi]
MNPRGSLRHSTQGSGLIFDKELNQDLGLRAARDRDSSLEPPACLRSTSDLSFNHSAASFYSVRCSQKTIALQASSLPPYLMGSSYLRIVVSKEASGGDYVYVSTGLCPAPLFLL